MINLYTQYYDLREQRLKIQREVDSLEQQEKDILYEITKEFTGESIKDSVDGFTMLAKRKDVPTVRDWSATLAYIKETGQVDLLQKRLTDSAVKARWDAGVDVPGVELTHKYVVTITKD